ncbi:hypothetical protein PHYSODRAFT_472017 [Phytophthora sojae]|uniref:Uncharacterized protein n=1 Tax=Phytophthora sojae (strain P6497) TaxID=1094619 RepID=G4YEK2_PHYSP|nr:hypothetical protein PHYSODRAFT_472017 [Phytophthora sojae]EGZ27279.1 hypothetical protein PHYSODRAFT_472017 [Phytophthora sojae]|eukprot:XP_009514554.1 hypothetical protein PHYSODRAFT_472017 [Phytophthora sojae]
MDEVAPATDQNARAPEEANAIHEEETAEKLTFAEMYTYLRSELTGLDLTRVKDVVSTVEYAEAMFAEVFNARPKEPLPADRNHYPELPDEEGERMLQFLLAHLSSGRSNERQWRAAMYDLARSIYKAHTRPLTKTIDHRIAELQVKAGPTSDPWPQKLLSKNEATDTDWSAVFHSLPFRSRRFPLQNEHPAVLTDSVDLKTRAALVWTRQVGADGIRDEQPRERYHVRLLNVSRFLDESALDAFIQGQFHGSYMS